MVPSPKLGVQERGGLPPSISLLVARAGKRSSTVTRNQSMLSAEKRQCQTSNPHLQRTLRRARPEVSRWITCLAGSSSSWELRAGRTGPTVIALPRLQTALKNGEKTHPRLSKLNYRSLPVGPQRGNDDRVSTYEGAYYMGDRLRHVVQLSLVPRA